jgi:hypothetical protein
VLCHALHPAHHTPHVCLLLRSLRQTQPHTPTNRTQDTSSTAAEKHALRYLELGQGGKSHRFLQYFVGHTARVTALALNPKNDTLLSAAQVCS